MEGALPKKLLLVDDTELFLKSFERLLSREGYLVTTAKNGLEAMDCIARDSFDLVVTDIEMPEMDGIELLRRIQGLKKDLAIIVLTAFGSTETEDEAMSLGASEYLEKPLDIDYIKEVIESKLRKLKP